MGRCAVILLLRRSHLCGFGGCRDLAPAFAVLSDAVLPSALLARPLLAHGCPDGGRVQVVHRPGADDRHGLHHLCLSLWRDAWRAATRRVCRLYDVQHVAGYDPRGRPWRAVDQRRAGRRRGPLGVALRLPPRRHSHGSGNHPVARAEPGQVHLQRLQRQRCWRGRQRRVGRFDLGYARFFEVDVAGGGADRLVVLDDLPVRGP
mmetsp:Transcript_52203/g.168058  ORF Transcript_52203/g.168058 Transcript_52203/m.168058 type:complete len:204 (+) Transcript_52203:555-1166(+)